MTLETLITVSEITGFIDMLLILFSYGASCIYNILFLRKAIWTEYSWIKLALSFCCFVFVSIYTYVFVRFLLNNPVNNDIFGILLVRTAICWMGIALFFASRARYNTLIHGGEKWIRKA